MDFFKNFTKDKVKAVAVLVPESVLVPRKYEDYTYYIKLSRKELTLESPPSRGARFPSSKLLVPVTFFTDSEGKVDQKLAKFEVLIQGKDKKPKKLIGSLDFNLAQLGQQPRRFRLALGNCKLEGAALQFVGYRKSQDDTNSASSGRSGKVTQIEPRKLAAKAQMPSNPSAQLQGLLAPPAPVPREESVSSDNKSSTRREGDQLKRFLIEKALVMKRQLGLDQTPQASPSVIKSRPQEQAVGLRKAQARQERGQPKSQQPQAARSRNPARFQLPNEQPAGLAYKPQIRPNYQFRVEQPSPPPPKKAIVEAETRPIKKQLTLGIPNKVAQPQIKIATPVQPTQVIQFVSKPTNSQPDSQEQLQWPQVAPKQQVAKPKQERKAGRQAVYVRNEQAQEQARKLKERQRESQDRQCRLSLQIEQLKNKLVNEGRRVQEMGKRVERMEELELQLKMKEDESEALEERLGALSVQLQRQQQQLAQQEQQLRERDRQSQLLRQSNQDLMRQVRELKERRERAVTGAMELGQQDLILFCEQYLL